MQSMFLDIPEGVVFSSSAHVIIVAGGSGSRMQSDLPKQFLRIDGRIILMRTIEQFVKAIPSIEVVLVLPEPHVGYWQELCKTEDFDCKHLIVHGGETRFHSVQNGLNALVDQEGVVAIHDGVRPLISLNTIKFAFLGAQLYSNAVVAVPLKDTIRQIDVERGSISTNRSDFAIVQTPQVFDLKLLKEAFLEPYQEKFTDDANVFQEAGHRINLVEGDYSNIKITTPEDIEFAEMLLSKANNKS